MSNAVQIYHPAQSVKGIAPENVFYVADSSGQPKGEAWILPSYHPNLFPERPLNIYMNINAADGWRDMLMGAILGRAQQIKDSNPDKKARLFSQVKPSEGALMNFYLENGFDQSDMLDVVRLGMPDMRAVAPMGYQITDTPINNSSEFHGLLGRINTYRLNAWSPQYMQNLMSFPHFFSISLIQGATIVGEAIFTGKDQSAKLMSIYIAPPYRRKGLAKCLIAYGMNRLYQNGVTAIDGDVIRRNSLQTRLAAACNATYVKTTCIYPGINYD